VLPGGVPDHTLIVMLENHNYSLLCTFENLYHPRPLGRAARATPITNVWR
jgi:hypothetical protein